MKVAIVTDDGQSVSAHFGRARAYAVLTVRDGAVRPMRTRYPGSLRGPDRGRPDPCRRPCRTDIGTARNALRERANHGRNG